MRVVSLHPAATDIAHMLDLDAVLVGISADSDWPPELARRVPVLNSVAIDTDGMTSLQIDAAAREGHRGSSLYHVDADRLRAVRPDLILTQDMCEVCAVSRRDVEVALAALGYAPTILSLNASTLDQMLEDVLAVARAAGVGERGEAVCEAHRARLDSLRQRTAKLARPRVLCMEWLDPPYSAGHWVPEMVDSAGGHDALGEPGGFSRPIAWTDITAYAPEVIVLIPCSLGLEQIAREFPSLRTQPGWTALAAVRAGRVYAANTDLFSRAGPRLVQGVEVLARLLHPEVFQDPLPPQTALAITADSARLEPFH